MNTLPIRAQTQTLYEFLKIGRFRVPEYQRPYSWEDEQVKDLWDDVQSQISVRDGGSHYHFFGTLLTAEGHQDPSPEGLTLEILDGQQRLATFTLLLAAIDRELEEIEESEDSSPKVRRRAKEARSQIADVVFVRPASGLRRVQLRSEEDQLLANIFHGNPPGSSLLGQAFQILHAAVREYAAQSSDLVKDLTGLMDVVLDRSVVIHARCMYGFDPFAVFTTLNARGLPLSAAQILRARTMGLVEGMSEGVRALTRKAWDKIEKLDEEGNRFLGYYLTMKEGRRIAAKEVVRRFDVDVLKALRPQSEDDFGRLAGELDDTVEYYGAILRKEWPGAVPPGLGAWRRRRLRLLTNELRVKQAVPLILAAAYRVPGDLPELLDIIERAAFVALMCFPNQTRWGDKLFAWAKEVYGSSMNVEDLRGEVRTWFVQQLGNPKRALSESLPIQLRYNGRKVTVLRYFLTTINDYGFPAPSPRKPDEQAEWDLRKIQVEHISARNVPDGIAPDLKDRLGNLTPLYGPANAALSNRPFDEKKPAYRDSPLRMTAHLATYERWNSETILKREQAIVDFAAALFCRDMEI